jgi:hypothetical protein
MRGSRVIRRKMTSHGVEVIFAGAEVIFTRVGNIFTPGESIFAVGEVIFSAVEIGCHRISSSVISQFAWVNGEVFSDLEVHPVYFG